MNFSFDFSKILKIRIFAQIISVIFHPVFIPLYCTLIFVNSLPFATLYSKAYKIALLATVAVFTCIIPVLYMLFKYLNGSIPDFYLKDRKKRTPIYIISFVSYAMCAVSLIRLSTEPFFLFVFCCSLIGFLVLAAVNLKWKISAHSCGAGVLCGAVFSFAYYLSANPVLLFCGVILAAGTIISSRLALKVHTFRQVAAGFFVGFVFSVLPVFIL